MKPKKVPFNLSLGWSELSASFDTLGFKKVQQNVNESEDYQIFTG